jgi:hypothetical protein
MASARSRFRCSFASAFFCVHLAVMRSERRARFSGLPVNGAGGGASSAAVALAPPLSPPPTTPPPAVAAAAAAAAAAAGTWLRYRAHATSTNGLARAAAKAYDMELCRAIEGAEFSVVA